LSSGLPIHDGEDPFTRLGQDFSSSFKIDKFVKSSEHYIPPTRVKISSTLTRRNRTFQYIPIIELAKKVSSQLEALPQVMAREDDHMMRDITSGTCYQDNPFFKENPEAMGIILASDEFDPCNALGASRGLHKILNVYATFVQIPKEHRQVVSLYFLTNLVLAFLIYLVIKRLTFYWINPVGHSAAFNFICLACNKMIL